MSETKYLLSLSSSPEGNEISLHADSEGLTALINELESLRKALVIEEAPHSHLMSESWGMDDLSESMLQSEVDENYRQVHHMKLYAWTKEWKAKHEL